MTVRVENSESAIARHTADATTSPKSLPNFFIGGAPKSGTTALATYLRDHPAVFFSEPKEPFFWADDLPTMRKKENCNTLEEYREIFSEVAQTHSAVGEGSTLYLFSETAIPNIVKQVPDARFVFMIRNPMVIAHAYHMQMVFHENEDQLDFEQAWSLQEQRKEGLRIPEKCFEPKLLQYRDIASVGSQIERVLELVDRDRVLLILFDDFVKDTRQSYLTTLEFLGLDDDGREEFQRVNAAMKSRFGAVSRLMRSAPVNAVTRSLKKLLSGKMYETARHVKHFFLLKRQDRDELSSEFTDQLKREFAPEVSKLESLLESDLSSWK